MASRGNMRATKLEAIKRMKIQMETEAESENVKRENRPTEKTVLSPEFKHWRRVESGQMEPATKEFLEYIRKFLINEKYMYRLSETHEEPIKPWYKRLGRTRVLHGIKLYLGTIPLTIGNDANINEFSEQIFRFLSGEKGPDPEYSLAKEDMKEDEYYYSHILEAYYRDENGVDDEWYVAEIGVKEIAFKDFDCAHIAREYPAHVRDQMDMVYERALKEDPSTTKEDIERFERYKEQRRLQQNKVANVPQQAASQKQRNVNQRPNTTKTSMKKPRNSNVMPNSANVPQHSGNSKRQKISVPNLAPQQSQKPPLIERPEYYRSYISVITGEYTQIITVDLNQPAIGMNNNQNDVVIPSPIPSTSAEVQSGEIFDSSQVERAIDGQDMPVDHPPIFYANGPVKEMFETISIYTLPDVIPRGNRGTRHEVDKYIDFSPNETKAYYEMDSKQARSPVSNEQQTETAVSSICEPNNLVPANNFGLFGHLGNGRDIPQNFNKVVQYIAEQEVAISQIPRD